MLWVNKIILSGSARERERERETHTHTYTHIHTQNYKAGSFLGVNSIVKAINIKITTVVYSSDWGNVRNGEFMSFYLN